MQRRLLYLVQSHHNSFQKNVSLHEIARVYGTWSMSAIYTYGIQLHIGLELCHSKFNNASDSEVFM